MALRAKPLPPLAELQQRYSYCPESGELRFREHRYRNRVGSLVGSPQTGTHTSYLNVYHNGRHLLVHRICYYLGTGKEPAQLIDHINGNGLDNRLINLRDVSTKVNARNYNTPIRTGTGVRGVYWDEPRQYFTAKATIDGRLTQLGSGDLLHCVALRKSAEQRLGYL